jgi:hypothetical protein
MARFGFLDRYNPTLTELARRAKKYAKSDPQAALGKLRLFGELIAREVGTRQSLEKLESENSKEYIERSRRERVTPGHIAERLDCLRDLGNKALHKNLGTRADALHAINDAYEVGRWFHKRYSANHAVIWILISFAVLIALIALVLFVASTPPGPANGVLNWRIDNYRDAHINVIFFSKSRGVAWPGGDEHFVVAGSTVREFALSCSIGKKICVGS